ncbi:MAG: bifunctional glutamate--cysteine ligase GshA/glutathione synthetase GshB [Fusobacteria bacterium]|nr:bifunctional glutamate--cysteine ligase GshA/glutathione synthetase GshB [Fusobacteriota bacterium]
MNLLKIVTDNNLTKMFIQGNFGLEKENLRVTKEGNLALSKHPEVFGDKQKNPYITTDFSESQIEMITPVRPSVELAYTCLENIHNCVLERLDGEYLWSQSIPPKLPSEERIPIAEFSDSVEGRAARVYREKLAENGKAKQLISGIHYNFSFSDEFILKLWKVTECKLEYKEFKSDLYMKLSRGFLKYRFVIIYLFGASFAMDKSFGHNKCGLPSLDEDTLYFKDATSFRNGRCGYNNKESFNVHYDSLESYIQGIENAISEGKIQGLSEFYSPIRLKTKNSKPTISLLKSQGVEYVEIRTIDLNPLNKIGLELKDIQFLHYFLLFCVCQDIEQTTDSLGKWAYNHNLVAEQGRNLDILLKDDAGEKSLKVTLNNFFDNFKEFLLKLELYENVKEIYTFQQVKVLNTDRTYVAVLEKLVRENGYITSQMNMLIKFHETALVTAYQMVGYEDLELSTQILLKAAIVKGVKFHFLDEDKAIVIKPKSTNFGIGISILRENHDLDAFKEALMIAFSHDIAVLVEEFIPGEEYRFLIIDGKVEGVLNRRAANVLGDGIHTIAELVSIKNQDYLRGEGYVRPLEKIQIAEIERALIKVQGYTEFDIVPQNITVFLRKNSNISTGGDSIDVTDMVTSKFKKLALLAAKSVSANVCGVDMLIDRIDDETSDYSVIELNFNPAIHIHCFPYQGKKRKIGDKIIDLLFKI